MSAFEDLCGPSKCELCGFETEYVFQNPEDKKWYCQECAGPIMIAQYRKEQV